MDTRPLKVLTFDCYGTLIDWESGLAAALAQILDRHGVSVPREQILAQHACFEPELQEGAFRPYREVLAGVVDRFGEHYGFRPAAAERDQLPASIRDWPPFDDTVAALHRLGQEFRLVILSNIKDDLFALSTPQLGVDYEAVISAQQVGGVPDLEVPDLATLADRLCSAD